MTVFILSCVLLRRSSTCSSRVFQTHGVRLNPAEWALPTAAISGTTRNLSISSGGVSGLCSPAVRFLPSFLRAPHSASAVSLSALSYFRSNLKIKKQELSHAAQPFSDTRTVLISKKPAASHQIVPLLERQTRSVTASGSDEKNTSNSRVDERLQKLIAQAGVASRRAAEDIIAAGRVSVNGRVVSEPGCKADPRLDDIRLDGRPLFTGRRSSQRGRLVYIALHKPKGYISTVSDELSRRTVLDLIPQQEPGVRLVPVGRLDADSEGLMLLTNDYALVNTLTHPRYQHTKQYSVEVRGLVTERTVQRLLDGVRWLDPDTSRTEQGWAQSVHVETVTPDRSVLDIVLTQGKKRQLRRMLLALGHRVVRLTRVAIGPVRLADLPVARWRFLSKREVEHLLAPSTSAASSPPPSLPSPAPTSPSRRSTPRSVSPQRPSSPQAQSSS